MAPIALISDTTRRGFHFQRPYIKVKATFFSPLVEPMSARTPVLDLPKAQPYAKERADASLRRGAGGSLQRVSAGRAAALALAGAGLALAPFPPPLWPRVHPP